MSFRVRLLIRQVFPASREDLRSFHMLTAKGWQRVSAADDVDALKMVDGEVLAMYDSNSRRQG